MDSDAYYSSRARLVTINEFLIRNSLHFSRTLMQSAGRYVSSADAVAELLSTHLDSPTAHKFAETSWDLLDPVQASRGLERMVTTYEAAQRSFETEFSRSLSQGHSALTGFWRRVVSLFRGIRKRVRPS